MTPQFTVGVMSIESSMAMVRFGLGRKLGETLPADPRAWLRAQLDAPDPALAQPGPSAAQALQAMHADAEARRQAAAAGTPQPERGTPEARAFHEEHPRQAPQMMRDDIAAMMTNLVQTDTPFRERLAWFWANHFTISTHHGDVGPLLGPYMREAIRPHVTGRFVDMLMAVMTHPAMLRYLDNASSVGPDSPMGEARHLGLNENLARECLELHTVTPAAGYTQADVTSFARILTGWSLEPTADSHGFVFRDRASEPGWHVLMGRSFPPGMQGGIQALSFLGQHPATYRHIATQMAAHFVADAPPRSAVAPIEAALDRSGGDLREAALALIDLPEAWQPQAKLRTPFDYVPAALRASGFVPQDGLHIYGWLRMLGQQPFFASLPNGWSDSAADWSGGEALLRRVDWSWAMAPRLQAEPAQVMEAALGPLAGADTAQAVRRAGSRREALTLLFASPEFARR
jgi:uncharacterized protein (DUF1800 family)